MFLEMLLLLNYQNTIFNVKNLYTIDILIDVLQYEDI